MEIAAARGDQLQVKCAAFMFEVIISIILIFFWMNYEIIEPITIHIMRFDVKLKGYSAAVVYLIT